MENTFEQVRAGVHAYCKAIHTQQADDFFPLWAEDVETVLIAPGGMYIGTEQIFRDFVTGSIQRAFERIDLIADEITCRSVTDDAVSVVFAYHTECIRRENGEPFGIAGLETQMWVRRGSNWKLAHVHYSGSKKD
jgi:hypothetical protein